MEVMHETSFIPLLAEVSATDFWVGMGVFAVYLFGGAAIHDKLAQRHIRIVSYYQDRCAIIAIFANLFGCIAFIFVAIFKLKLHPLLAPLPLLFLFGWMGVRVVKHKRRRERAERLDVFLEKNPNRFRESKLLENPPPPSDLINNAERDE